MRHRCTIENLKMAGDAFQGPLGEWALQASEQYEGTPEPLLLTTLVMFGAATGRGAFTSIGADLHRSNEFLCVLGGTGTGKGQSFSMARRLFEEIDLDWTKRGLHSGLSSGEGLIQLVSDPEPGGPQDRLKNVLVFESEASRPLRVMKREGSTLSPILRDAWDGREKLEVLTLKAVKSTSPLIAVLLHSTPEELLDTLPPLSLVNGFLNRFILALSSPIRELPFGGEAHKILPRRLVEILKANLASARRKNEIGISVDARAVWERHYSKIIAPEEGAIGEYKARGRAHIRRLSMLFCLAEGLDEVQASHLQAAIHAWNYSLEVARRLLDRLAPGKPNPKQTIRLSLESGPKTKSDLHGVFGRNKSGTEIADLLEQMMRSGEVELEPGAGGRAAVRYRLKLTNYEFDESNELEDAPPFVNS